MVLYFILIKFKRDKINKLLYTILNCKLIYSYLILRITKFNIKEIDILNKLKFNLKINNLKFEIF